MGDVEGCVPPASVTLEGSAMSAVGRLSQVAKHLAAVLPNLADGDRQALKEAITMTNQVIGILNALDTTVTRLERRADQIVNLLNEGEEATFCNQGSNEYFIRGVLAKRVRTVIINLVTFATAVPDRYANTNVKDNIIISRGGRHNARRAMLRVAC